MHQLTGDFYTVGEVLGHTLAGIGVSLGLSMNFEAVTARYVDVRLERKKKSWTLIMGLSNRQTRQRQRKPSRRKQRVRRRKRAAKLSFNRLIFLLLLIAFYSPAWDLGTIWAPLAENAPPKQAIKETPRTRKNIVFMRVSGVF